MSELYQCLQIDIETTKLPPKKLAREKVTSFFSPKNNVKCSALLHIQVYVCVTIPKNARSLIFLLNIFYRKTKFTLLG